MKKTSTIKVLLLSSAMLFLFFGLFAQKTVNVPGDHATILVAINQESKTLVDGDELIITLNEGLYEQSDKYNFNWKKRLKITILGAGADKTILKSNLSAPPVWGEVSEIRFAAVTNALMSGSEINFKDLTFKYFGASEGNGSIGTILQFAGKDMTLTSKFTNVIFDSNMGFSLINANNQGHSFEFENCLFINNIITYQTQTPPIEKAGLIAIRRGGNLTLRNSTFISNENIEYDGISGNHGSLMWLGGDTASQSNIIMENNAFINTTNRVPHPDSTLTSYESVISFLPNMEADQYNVTMKNNIAIGNGRPGFPNDVDVVLANPEKITFVESSGNIFNRVIKVMTTEEVVGEEIIRVRTYVDFNLPGSKISPLYTYANPDILFEMDGALPKLTVDANGIGHVKYTGDGGTPPPVSVNIRESDPVKIYAFNRVLQVEGLKSGDVLEIYNITGSLFSSTVVTTDRFEKEMPKGIYIVRAGKNVKKVLVH